MAVDKTKWVRGNNLADTDFNFDDTTNEIKVKTDATSAVGIAIAAIPVIEDATDTVKGKVALAVDSNFPSTSDTEATTPAYVDTAISTAIAAIPVIEDATDTVKGKVALAVDANFPSTSDTEATTPAYVDTAISTAISAIPAVPDASTTVKGVVELATNAETITGTSTTLAVTPAGVAAALGQVPSLTVSATAPASPIVGDEWYDTDNTGRTYVWTGAEWADENPAGFAVEASETTKGVVELATTAETTAGTSTTLAVTPAGVAAAITANAAAAVPDASATVAGKVNLVQDQVLGAGRKIVDQISGRYVAAASAALDTRTAEVFSRTVSGATTFTFTNPNATGVVTTFVLELTNGGSAAVTWPTGTKWEGGTAPALTASGLDILGFYTRDGGTTWRGIFLSKDNK